MRKRVVFTMRISKKSPKKEKRIMTFSLYANLFFVIVELFMAVYTSSQTVLLDAVYDGIEFFMLLPSDYSGHLAHALKRVQRMGSAV